MNIIETIFNIVYPPKCIFCQALLDHKAVLHVCGTCYSELPLLGDIVHKTTPDEDQNYCDGVISLFEYTGMVKESLIRFKFYNKPGYYRTYARLMADRIRKTTDVTKYNMVLSVPLHKHREFSRGYNQARLISKELSRILRLPECSYILKRERYTEAQSLLDKHKRNQNVKGAFVVVAPKKARGKNILLVDDILTTGSTLEECSRVLKQAGAGRIFSAVVATGRK